MILISITVIDIGSKAMAKDDLIQLPKPIIKSKVSLEEAILKRRSKRSFTQEELTTGQMSQLLWAAQGITEKKANFSLRAAPSAGALYPMEIYALTKDGLFHYFPEKHTLKLVEKKDLRKTLASASFGQSPVSQAPLDIVICAVYSRVTSKYGQRGRRYTDIEAGHIAQNIHLEAVSLGLGSVPIGAFDDKKVKSVLTLPKDEEPLYIIPVGYAD